VIRQATTYALDWFQGVVISMGEHLMLTPGNRKLGGDLIWSFALPSGTSEVCVGMTATCQKHCYAVRFSQYRKAAQAKYQRNLELSRLPDFAQRMRYFIVNEDIRVVRNHTGGDYYSVPYARKWLQVIRWLPEVKFYFYTRSWRNPGIRKVIEQMAELPNARVWFSCDRDTGVPSGIPASVRVCWLMTHLDDAPPQPVDLIFRIQRLRKLPLPTLMGSRVCPDENGKSYAVTPQCESCGYCWRPKPLDLSLSQPLTQRRSLVRLENAITPHAPSHGRMGQQAD
jgi:hypothetical protein